MAKELRRDWQTYVRIARYLRGKGWYFVVAILAYLLAASGEVFFAWTIGAVVDTFNPPPVSVNGKGMHGWLPSSLISVAVPPPILFPCFIFAAGFVRAIGTITGEYLLSRVSFHVVHSVRCDLYNRLLELPSSYFDRNSYGSLSNRLTDTTSKLRDTATDVQKNCDSGRCQADHATHCNGAYQRSTYDAVFTHWPNRRCYCAICVHKISYDQSKDSNVYGGGYSRWPRDGKCS